MGNLFDGLQNALFDTVTNTMGYTAWWLPTAPGTDFNPADFKPADFLTGGASSLKTAKVLYNGPTERERLLDANFDPENIKMEYKHGDFDGLYETARESKFELIHIETIGYFVIRSISKKWDGKTYNAKLERYTGE